MPRPTRPGPSCFGARSRAAYDAVQTVRIIRVSADTALMISDTRLVATRHGHRPAACRAGGWVNGEQSPECVLRVEWDGDAFVTLSRCRVAVQSGRTSSAGQGTEFGSRPSA